MDIISHSLSGVAVGTVVAAVSKVKPRHKLLMVLIGGLGGALPDIDALSLGSKFDATLGALFGLNHSGREIYFGKFWYSHHGALHSLVAPLLLILIYLGSYLLRQRSSGWRELKNFWRRKRYYLASFYGGFLVHLLEDMPTPASVWGGVRFFFPSEQYIGGWGKIWWWNNYDLVLLIIGVILLNGLLNFLPSKLYRIKAFGAMGAFSIGVLLFIVQINSRPVDFSYQNHAVDYPAKEQASKDIQREILGDKLYSIMSEIDEAIPLYF